MSTHLNSTLTSINNESSLNNEYKKISDAKSQKFFTIKSYFINIAALFFIIALILPSAGCNKQLSGTQLGSLLGKKTVQSDDHNAPSQSSDITEKSESTTKTTISKNKDNSKAALPATCNKIAAPKEKSSTTAKQSDDALLPVKSEQAKLDGALEFCQAAQDFWQKGDLDNALEALDQAYSFILSIDTMDDPKLIQQKEDVRFTISKRILEIYASRNIVVNGNHNAIPIVINKYVKREIKLFTTGGERRFFIQSYKRSGKYRPKIVKELKAAGLPTELSWLPLIESGYKVKALSKARALGLWQFIPSTGYKFGLKRDLYIDSRMDPDKATIAAIGYLTALHKIFGDWTTALASYNCGEGRVLRIIRTQNIKYLDDFWDLYQKLPRETARYVPRFLATLHIINNLEKYGMADIKVDAPEDYSIVKIDKQVHLKDVASAINVDKKALSLMNPELRYSIIPGEGYPLKVPSSKANQLTLIASKLKVASTPRPAFIYHRVRNGEALSTIARRYRTSVRSIAYANNINKRNYIVAGKLLKIPAKGSLTYRKPAPKKYTGPTPARHLVKRGDSLWILAKKYNTTTRRIMSLNSLMTTNLRIGQVLRIPGGKKTIRKGSSRTYSVKAGDSAFSIARRHNMPLNKFLEINSMTHNNTIYPGQKLYVE